MNKATFIEVAMRNAEEKIKQLESQNESLKQRCAELERQVLQDKGIRFEKPTDKSLVEISLIFNDEKLDQKILTNMVAMSEFIIDRLYDNGNVETPSKRELDDLANF